MFPMSGVCAVFAAALMWPAALGAQTTTPSPADALFDNQVLHRIELTINTRDWEKLKANFQDNEYYATMIAWRGQTMRNAYVRSRGSGSRSGTKPGLRLDFNRTAAGAQEWLGLKSLILDNLKQDPSGMREMLAFRLFERMGLPAPRESFTELYVNGKLAGLYVIVEPVDKRYLARTFGEREAGDTENDGYLFEYRWKYPYQLTYLGRELEKYQEILEPKTHETESISGLYDPIERMVREINESRDDLFERNVAPYLDLPLFMKHVATQNLLAEWDGLLGYAGLNNTYLYRFEKKTLSQFLVWDADNTFREIEYSITGEHENNVLMKRAMKIPALRSAYFTSLLEAARSAEEYSEDEAAADVKLKIAPRGWLEREIDRLYAQIRTAMRSDTLKAFTDAEFEEAILYLRQFARERGPYVRCEVAKITEPSRAPRVCAAAGS
jgi:hypothetical protein